MRRVQIYDTLSREKRLFVPLNPPKVGLFVCGLTPYDEAHIGHAKTIVTFDVVTRALRRWGYRVFYVQNVTNLDDKVLQRAAQVGSDPLQMSERYFLGWLLSMEKLGVRSVNYYPFATDYLPEIIEQIRQLIAKGFAYPVDGSVYYEVSKFRSYGKLSGQKTEALRPGARLEVDRRKRAPEDFVLWKAAVPGEPVWESPWGPGRPGWHIEDTAITVRLLGPRYDLHGAGIDLIFPHHESEIAQAEAATGESPLVNFWMHAGMLNLHQEKMAKSVGNVISLERTLREFEPAVLRFFFLNAQYRSPLEFVPGRSLEEAREAYENLVGPFRRITEVLRKDGIERGGRELPPDLSNAATDLVEKLDEVLADDFNTREVIALLFGWTKRLGEWTSRLDSLSGSALATLSAPYRWGEQVLGLFPSTELPGPSPELSRFLQIALDARARARARGDFAEADRIRTDLERAGVHLEDQGESTRWHLHLTAR